MGKPICVRSNEDSAFELALRIPEYVNSYTVLLDNIPVEGKIHKGYLYLTISRNVKIHIDFEIPPRFMRSNPLVRENSGKVAIVKGPLVYCIEEIDNENNLAAYFINTNETIKEKYQGDILCGTNVLKFVGKKISQENWNEDKLYLDKDLALVEKELTAVLYCYWGNRNAGERLCFRSSKA